MLQKTTSFGTFVVRLAFYARLGSQRLQFHNLLQRPREDLITMNLRMRDHILNCGCHIKLLGIMKYLMGARVCN